jgi:hypothetical protein
MAHQFSSGVFCYNKPAWHRLGVVVDGTLPAREAFRIANADFQVAGRPVFDADMQPIPGYQAITRMQYASYRMARRSPSPPGSVEQKGMWSQVILCSST